MKGDGRAKGKKRKVSVFESWAGVDGGAVSSFERELGRWNVGQVPAPPPPLATSHHHQTHKTLHTLQATYYQHTTQNITHITSYTLPTHYTCAALCKCVVTHYFNTARIVLSKPKLCESQTSLTA